MTDWLLKLIQTMTTNSTDEELLAQLQQYSQQVRNATPDERNSLFEQLVHTVQDRPDASRFLLQALCETTPKNSKNSEKIAPSAIETLDQLITPRHVARLPLLLILIRQSEADDLKMFADLITTRPPEKPEDVAPAFALMLQQSPFDPTPLFPKLLAGLQHNSTAGLILDFTNFLVRSRRTPTHLAISHAKSLTELLGLLVGQLGTHEDSIRTNPNPDLETTRSVTESISLVISLCDALSLMGAQDAVGKLFQLLELSHRRLRVEAAAALVRLEQTSAVKTLAELASEPLVRLRVLAYAEELEVLDQVQEKYSSPQARSESELTLLLAEPTHFGFPPSQLERIDQRSQFWPGYDEQVECQLFKYTYSLEQGELSNVAIVGPVTQALSAYLADLPVDDIYACYAGWHAEHEEIFTIEIDENNSQQAVEIAKFRKKLTDAGFGSVEPLFLGSFFGARSLIASAQRDSESGCVVANPDDVSWFPNPAGGHARPPVACYDMVKGRKLLRSFNSPE